MYLKTNYQSLTLYPHNLGHVQNNDQNHMHYLLNYIQKKETVQKVKNKLELL